MNRDQWPHHRRNPFLSYLRNLKAACGGWNSDLVVLTYQKLDQTFFTNAKSLMGRNQSFFYLIIKSLIRCFDQMPNLLQKTIKRRKLWLKES